MSSRLSLSSSKNLSKNNFYSTSMKPISYYSSKSFQSKRRNSIDAYISKKNNYYSNKSPENLDKKYSKNIFKSRINKSKPSPFYLHEKSARLQNEIDWINRLVHNKAHGNINELIRINPSYINKTQKLIKFEDDKNDEITAHMINNMRLDNLKKIMKIKDTLRNGSVILNKRHIDNYNYKNFMYQMKKFKNNGINKWRNDFKRKFYEY